MTTSKHIPPRTRGPAFLLALILLAYLVTRAILLATIALQPKIEAVTGAFVHLRQLDVLLGYAGLLGLAIFTRVERARMGDRPSKLDVPITIALLLAAATFGIAQFWPDIEGRAQVDVVASATLVLAGVLTAVAILSSLAKRRGVTLTGLWQFLAAQWVLAWVGADLVLRWKLRTQGGVASHDYARDLVVWLPALGVLLNAILMTITTLSAATNATRIKPRGILIALILINIGSLLFVIGGRWTKIISATILLSGLALWWAAIGSRHWPATTILLGAAFMLLMDRALQTSPSQLQAATRHLFIAGTLLTTIGACVCWLDSKLPSTLARPTLAKLALNGLLISIILTTLLHILAIGNSAWISAITIASVLELLSLLLAAALGLRSLFAASRTPSSQ